MNAGTTRVMYRCAICAVVAGMLLAGATWLAKVARSDDEESSREQAERVQRERAEFELRRLREVEERERAERERAERERAEREHAERERAEREHHEFDRDQTRARLGAVREMIGRLADEGRVEDAQRLEQEARELVRLLEGGGRPHGAPPQVEAGDFESRMHHLHMAIENLNAGGFHDQAENLARMASEMERDFRRAHEPPHRDSPHEGGIEQAVDSLHQELQQMRREIEELRNAVRELSEPRRGR